MGNTTENTMLQEEEQVLETAFARTYGVELFFQQTPQIDQQALLKAMKAYCGNVSMADTEPENQALLFFHHDHKVHYTNAHVPAQFVVLLASSEGESRIDYHASLQQSWHWREAQAIIEQAPHTLLATDMMSSGLPYKERIQLFRSSLRAVVETVSCQAIHCHITQQFVSPEQYLDTFQDEHLNELFGVLNVRFFTIQHSDEMIMDTLGLAAIGLPDLQCHFRELEPNRMANILYDTACYIYEHGDIIKDGQTVQGLKSSDKWICQHEMSILEPQRVVLDIHPGIPYAGGNRT